MIWLWFEDDYESMIYIQWGGEEPDQRGLLSSVARQGHCSYKYGYKQPRKRMNYLPLGTRWINEIGIWVFVMKSVSRQKPSFQMQNHLDRIFTLLETVETKMLTTVFDYPIDPNRKTTL